MFSETCAELRSRVLGAMHLSDPLALTVGERREKMGYMSGGVILRVDLTSGKVTKEPTSRYEELWIGGRGLNARIMYEEVGPEVKPLYPENILMFSVGPFTGTMVPGSGRTEISAKSPTTGAQGMSNMGGYWGPELKYAGYDSLIVGGKASKPVYIAIDNDEVLIKDASHLWGMDTYETPVAIRKELGDPDVELVCIGPAGENLVVYATIQTRVGNAAGRTGMGAVMGSKNLKAVAVRGTKGVSIAEPEKFFNLCTKAFEAQSARVSPAQTVNMVENNPPSWGCVLGNLEATVWDKQKELKGGHEPFWSKHRSRQGDGRIGCFNCRVRCIDYYDLPDLGPLMASCSFYGSTMWVLKDPDFVSWYALSANCHRNGIDVVTTSKMIAWAMELYEKGKISREDTDGIALHWGEGDAINRMVEKIVKREGFGDVLASTVGEARDRIGRGVEEALNVKGTPIVGTNPISFRSRAIGSAVNPRGGDPFRTRYGCFDSIGSNKDSGIAGMASPDSWEGKRGISIIKEALAKEEDKSENPVLSQFDYVARGALAGLAYKLTAVSDMLGQCRWNTIMLNMGIGIEFQADTFSAGEGRKINIEDLLEVASRVAAQERAFAVREGLSREQDTLPKRAFNLKLPGTWPEDKLDPVKFEKMLDEYYEAMEWDVKTGIPTPKTLQSLKLSDVAADLEKLGKLPKQKRSTTAVSSDTI